MMSSRRGGGGPLDETASEGGEQRAAGGNNHHDDRELVPRQARLADKGPETGEEKRPAHSAEERRGQLEAERRPTGERPDGQAHGKGHQYIAK